MSREQFLEDQLRSAHKGRAMVYAAMLQVLERRLGAAEAEQAMMDAIYARGQDAGRRFTSFAPDDMRGLAKAFLEFVPDRGRLFAPEVRRCDSEGVDIHFHRCPLKEAWEEAGIPVERRTTLCRIAAHVDNGTFEPCGFSFSAETWQPGEEGCCTLHLRPGICSSEQ